MIKLEKIKQRIAEIIDREIKNTQLEIEEYAEKINDNIEVYGEGKNYSRFEKAKKRREQHLEDLLGLKNSSNQSIAKKKVRLYPYYCPDCLTKIYMPLQSSRTDKTIVCPLCERRIYPSFEYEEWEQIKGTHFAKLQNGFVDMDK